MMKRAVLVYTTWPSIVEAEAAGRKIVERRQASIRQAVISQVSRGGYNRSCTSGILGFALAGVRAARLHKFQC